MALTVCVTFLHGRRQYTDTEKRHRRACRLLKTCSVRTAFAARRMSHNATGRLNRVKIMWQCSGRYSSTTGKQGTQSCERKRVCASYSKFAYAPRCRSMFCLDSISKSRSNFSKHASALPLQCHIIVKQSIMLFFPCDGRNTTLESNPQSFSFVSPLFMLLVG